MSEIFSKTHTSCKACTFAQYQDRGKDEGGADLTPTQVGCGLDLLERFRGRGEVVDAYDEEKEFCVVNGRACPGYRTDPGATPESARKEMTLRLAAVVLLDADSTADGLRTTLNSLAGQTPPLREVVVVNNFSGMSPGRVVGMLAATGLAYQLVQVCEKGPEWKAVDLGVDQVRESTFYAKLHAGTQLPPALAEKLDRELNVNLGRFALLTPRPGGDLMVASVSLHRHHLVNGEGPALAEVHEPDGTPTGVIEFKDLVAKATYLAERGDCLRFIRPLDEVLHAE